MTHIKHIAKNKGEKGFALIYAAVLVLAIIITAATSIAALTYNEQILFRDMIKSTQSYYAAESGLEDMVLRLENGMNLPSSYSFNVGTASVSNTISDEIGGSRTIIAEGNLLEKIRKLEVVYQTSSHEVAFYYGAQVGEGGMEMGNGSQVLGNIYSNGNVVGGGTIEDTIIVAHNGNRIEGLNIGQNAKAYSCKDCKIQGDLTYVTGGTIDNCDVSGSITEQSEEIQPKSLPIPESKINEWKQDAEAGGIIEGDYIIDGRDIQDFGPKKITGQLIVNNNAVLNMTGSIWAVGGIRIDNGATIQLDTTSYGSLSGILLTDGKVKIKPGVILLGSGQSGSYLLILSTDPETENKTNPAIDVDNNADAAIFYTTRGLIVLRNNVQAKEVTGYKIYLDNNAVIAYEAGLTSADFSSGPAGSKEVVSWKEVE
ncbi:MAG: hypothetical protein KJI70_02770 [Patescibacteria group bacterium]|nr:hypothetical protein [Patescibacteria group bacterium]